MEFVPGNPLSRLIPPGGMPTAEVVRLAIQIADGLAKAHAVGIVHRDLKPGNIMITDDGRVKLLDFGLAKSMDTRLRADATTRTIEADTSEGAVVGSRGYMSPEQAEGKPVDRRSDIFSFGTVLREMLTGRRTSMGYSQSSAMLSMDQVPPHLQRIIAKALQKDRALRYGTASEMGRDLAALLTDPRSVDINPPAAPSVAVLPFADLSREQDQDYFCEGVAEEIANALSRINRLAVASRASAFQFRSADPREVGRRLRVGTLVEGSVRRSGSRLRIVTRLTDADTGYQLWSGAYDREIADIFAIQQEIASNVARALELSLTAEEHGVLSRTPTTDVRAYEHYLRGRKFYYLYTRSDVESAIRLFSHAIELDPDYVLAYAGLADCWSWIYLYSLRSESARQQTDAASQRAVALDPRSAQAQASRALALSLYGRHAEAEASFEAAIGLDPALFEAYYFYARQSFAAGNLDKAAILYQRAIQVRPDDYQSHLLVAQIYDDLGRRAEARASRRRGVWLAERQFEDSPGDARARYMAANALVAMGERERGREWADRALAIMPDEPLVLYNVGCIYSMLGCADEAVSCLERAVAAGLTDRGFFEHDSNLDPIRKIQRFVELLASL